MSGSHPPPSSDEPLFPMPDERVSDANDEPQWKFWRPGGTCDACALLLGTGEATYAAQKATLALHSPDGTVHAYCTTHAREHGWFAEA